MAVAKTIIPRFVVVQIEDLDCVKYVSPAEVVWEKEGTVFDILAMVEFEPTNNGDDYFHLRFCHTNKYWARGQGEDSGLLVANSNNPEEDTSNPSCTLFQLITYTVEPYYFFKHVQSGGFVKPTQSGSAITFVDDSGSNWFTFSLVNWEKLVIMPKHVAFKGDNGKFLKAVWTEGHPYLQFSSDDANQKESGYEISFLPEGLIRIKSDYFGKFWRRNSDWIWGDVKDDGDLSNLDTHFWPVKIDNRTIALRARENNNFCKRLTMEGNTNCLNAAVSTITNETKLVVQELVLQSKVYNVIYKMEDARIYDKKPYLAGTTTAINNGDDEASISVSITYEDSKSYSFSKSVSITGGVSATIDANVLGIVKGAVEFSFSVTGAFEWNDTTTTTKTVQATGAVRVPAKSFAVVRYVGTVGTCDVPFAYTQQDESSVDGNIVQNEGLDGIFNGVNCYDFNFEFGEIKPL